MNKVQQHQCELQRKVAKTAVQNQSKAALNAKVLALSSDDFRFFHLPTLFRASTRKTDINDTLGKIFRAGK